MRNLLVAIVLVMAGCEADPVPIPAVEQPLMGCGEQGQPCCTGGVCGSGYLCLTDGCGKPPRCLGARDCGKSIGGCCNAQGFPEYPPGGLRCSPGLQCVSGGCLPCP